MTRPHPISWLRSNERFADAILAVVMTALAVSLHLLQIDDGTDQTFREPTWWTTLFVIGSVLPIALRRTQPIRSGLFIVAVQIVTALLDIDGTGFLGVVIALYSLGAHTSGPRRTNAVAAIAAGIGLLFVSGLVADEVMFSDLVGSVIVLITAFVLGDNLRRRRDKADALAERAERAEREQALIAQQQVNAERTRIARELHDVVAHSVSVMVIQAAAARRSLASSPESAEAALVNIEDTGRQTMNELRGILGVLRKDVDDDARAPQPTLAELPAFADAATDLPIELVVDADSDLDNLPGSVTLTGFRVVQEALTNVRRHAGPVTRVGVAVRRTPEHLEITVADDGRGAAADDLGPGFGLVGMRERVAAVGGTVSAGAQQGGGWRVHMVLPLGAPSPGQPHRTQVSPTDVATSSSPEPHHVSATP
jgi:signal transduction histidine kinase